MLSVTPRREPAMNSKQKPPARAITTLTVIDELTCAGLAAAAHHGGLVGHAHC